MKPKEKAIQLLYKFKKYSYYPKTDDDEIFANHLNKNAKQCALIAVDEIIINMNHLEENGKLKEGFGKFQFWLEVKNEINKL